MRADCLNGTGIESLRGSEFGGQFEMDVFAGDRALADRVVAETVERAHPVLHQSLGRGGTGGQAEPLAADQQLGRNVGTVLDERGAAASPLGYLHEPTRVG